MQFHLNYLCNFNDRVKPEDLPSESLKRVWSGKWCTEKLEHSLKHWWNQKDDANQLTVEDSEELLCVALELLLAFIQQNFTGPFCELTELEGFVKELQPLVGDFFVELKENGEEINPNVVLGEFLLISRAILNKLLSLHKDCVVLHWWHLRYICIHQHIIDELTSNLYEQLKIEADWLLTHLDQLNNREYEALLYLEIANSYLQYHRGEKASEILDKLCQHLSVNLVVEGLLGVRTKFQQKPLPQLCLKVQQTQDQNLPKAQETNGETSLPKLLLHEDDTRLERIRFIEEKDNEVMTLPSVLQALVLSKVRQLKRCQPKDRLADEELEPYTHTLLYQQHGPLQVRQSALLLNCVQESNHRRTVERSWKQCEEAVKLLCEHNYSAKERFSYAFAGFLQPKWQIQLQLCELLLSLGMVKTALDIYLKIQAWEQVIDCYTRLELRHKAAEIIEQELKKTPTVLLYCLLGDATDSLDCYEKAWEFSKHTSGKAQAHWGNYYFFHKQYEEAIEHLQKSVEINSLQEKIWLRLGYAAIMLEKWELAVHAYITYTHLEPLGFESWNNLAKALIKLGDKQRAHKVLAESLKCNYNNWKVWENFMVVSVDTGNFEDAMNAYNRLSELKTHYLDLEVLCITTTAIAEGKPDAKGQTQERLLKKATNLMGHQCVKHGSEPKIWELAALLAPTPLKKADKLVKAFRAYTAKELVWVTKQPFAQKALELCLEMSQKSLEAITNHSEDESEVMITSQLNSARLADQACIRAIEKEPTKFPENLELLENVKTLLEKMTAHVKQRMGA
ncbi:tetratricopeptide repeat protein 27 [Stomoxys calcitrans]|uniref:tetratricopeptide repeat protein 27 n=1 Tax=Stomoxys calcitrans TaxID=35570 RepID=UPI0027E26115|nr:tetratricopeptide repeat protein 27 [Stomoxys calcitrans]